jgi:hypothetical protein
MSSVLLRTPRRAKAAAAPTPASPNPWINQYQRSHSDYYATYCGEEWVARQLRDHSFRGSIAGEQLSRYVLLLSRSISRDGR